jgi:hypothetical protein
VASENGHVDILQWILDGGCPWDRSILIRAAKNNHLNVFDWSRDKGHLWEEDACVEAVDHCNLEILKWAEINRKKFDMKRCLERARSKRNSMLLPWVKSSKSHMTEETAISIQKMRRMVRWLEDRIPLKK